MPDKPTRPDLTNVVASPVRDASISYMNLSPPKAVAVGLEKQDPLPALVLDHPLHLNGATLSEALSLVLADSGISFLISPGVQPLASGQVSGVKGPLPNVLRALSEAYGVFFSYSGGILRAEAERQFIVELPPVKELATSVEAALKQRNARMVSMDHVTGNLSYRANYLTARALESYLDTALSQPLLVLETQIFEVRLNSSNSTGIQWDKFTFDGKARDWSLNTSSSLAGQAGSLALTGTLGPWANIELLLKFLATQGTVTTASQPQVHILSGSSQDIKVGETLRYVSKIGTTQVGSSNSAQTTTELGTQDTGLELKVGGRYWQGAVVASIKLKMTELLSMEDVSVGPDQTLKLPRTAQRDLGENILRLRPGETGMLFGLISTRDASARQGLSNTPLLGALTTTRLDSSKERNELVVLVRPRVVMFGSEPKEGASK